MPEHTSATPGDGDRERPPDGPVAAGPSIAELVASYRAAGAGRAATECATALFQYYLDFDDPGRLGPGQRLHESPAPGEDEPPPVAFSEMLGRGQIFPALRQFLGTFLGRRELLQAYRDPDVVSEVAWFATWLADEGCLDRAEAEDIARLARRFVGRLARAHRATKYFRRATGRSDAPFSLGEDRDDVVLGDFLVVRIRRGTLWLRDRWHPDEIYGPVRVRGRGPDLIDEGWMLAASLRRERGRWRLTDVRGVYPMPDEGAGDEAGRDGPTTPA